MYSEPDTEILAESKKELSIFDQLRSDLFKHFSSYQNESAAYASFEDYSGLHRKTLKRFLESNSTAYPQTLVRFYKWLFKSKCEKSVLEKLGHETKQFLATNGYNMISEKKDITQIICKSTNHLEIYLKTEDQQILTKEAIEKNYGNKGLEALNDLLLNEIITSIDEKTFTTGPIRSDESVEYFKNASILIPKMLPWEKVENNYQDESIGFTLGNIISSRQDKELINKAVSDFKKKLCHIHDRGMKASPEEREMYVYSTVIFKPLSEREEDQ